MISFFNRGWTALLLLLGPTVRAQFNPVEVAQYQRRLQAIRFDHCFWDAPPDSLRRWLATQRVDSQRLQTLDAPKRPWPKTGKPWPWQRNGATPSERRCDCSSPLTG